MNGIALLNRVRRVTPRTSFRATIRSSIVGVCGVMVAACSGTDLVQLPAAPDAERLWAVRLNTRALALADGDTYQLSATPLNAKGETLTSLPPIRFVSLNAERIRVDSTGLVTALSVVSPAQVVAKLTVDGVTRADTVWVYVTPTSHSVRSMALIDWITNLPIPTQLNYNASLSFNAQVLDQMGAVISGITPSVVSSDPRILNGGSSYAFGTGFGKAKLLMSMVAYGEVLRDSVEIAVRVPANQNFTLYVAPSGNSLVATGGTITWTNNTWENKVFNITFENSATIVGGNVEQLTPYSSETRTFTAPGTYRYRDTINNTSGVILVRDQPAY